MDSRTRNGVGRFVRRLAIIVAGTVALGLLLVIGVAVTTGSLRFVPAGAFVRSDGPTFTATVGSTVPNMAGRRLDGTEDSLSAYRGRVVLLDFWATWCKPCVDALPELRALAAELPAERFTLLAISVDFDRETVLRFMENEPMPWVNWHAGLGGGWGIRRFPTYVLIDEHGLVLDRTNDLTGSLVSTLREAVEGATEPVSGSGTVAVDGSST